MKVTHVCPFIGEQLGGSERYVYNLSNAQSERHDVHIVTTTRHASKVGQSTWNGVTIHRLYAPVTIWNIDPLCYAFGLLTQLDYDILHIHSYLYTLSAQAIVAKLARNRRSILQLHGGVGPPPYRTSFARRAVKLAYDASVGKMVLENSDIISSVSRKDLHYVSENYSVDESALRYVPNAVDTGVFSPGPAERKDDIRTILYVGDLEPWKGLSLLMQWAMSDSVTSCRLRFVGQGSLHSELEELKKKVAAKNNGVQIEILGQRPHEEIPEIMRQSDALVLPSYWEGMPTVVLEAMACRIPPIVTPVGDVADIVQDGVNGLLVENTHDSIDEAFCMVCSQPETTGRMGQEARRTIERRFSLRAVLRTVEGLYVESIN
jgi:glycosyltransferase involved in cell wall biosynthesis